MLIEHFERQIEHFKRQLDYLTRYYTIYDVQEILAATRGEPQCQGMLVC